MIQEDIVRLKEYLASIIGNPTSFDKQLSIFNTEGQCMWCEEWELIEMLKYLINGEDMYRNDPPPNRLKKSTVWSKEDIMAKTKKLPQSVDEIIVYFNHRRELYGSTSGV